jgi:predicted nucleic acid-binding protein
MNAWILDASVAAKWFLPPGDETLVEEALSILTEFGSGRCRLMVPDLFWAEMSNILWKAARTGRITRRIAQEATDELLALNLETRTSKALAGDALRLALAYDRPVCDSIYVALSVITARPLLTADERLVNALGHKFPVRWLGAVEIT